MAGCAGRHADRYRPCPHTGTARAATISAGAEAAEGIMQESGRGFKGWEDFRIYEYYGISGTLACNTATHGMRTCE